MGPKDFPFGGAPGAARQPAPESTNEGNVFELPGLAGGDPAQAAGVMGTMMELVQQKGGLGGLLDTFRAMDSEPRPTPGPATVRISRCRRSGRTGAGEPDHRRDRAEARAFTGSAKATLSQLVPAITSRMAAEERLTGEPSDDSRRRLGMLKNITG